MSIYFTIVTHIGFFFHLIFGVEKKSGKGEGVVGAPIGRRVRIGAVSKLPDGNLIAGQEHQSGLGKDGPNYPRADARIDVTGCHDVSVFVQFDGRVE